MLEEAPVAVLRNTTAPPVVVDTLLSSMDTGDEVAPLGSDIRILQGEGAQPTNRALGLELLLI
ncbi:MAG TPA: hypothetical protein VFP64_01980 [Pyrinomonadaceae bacterium]|nr:hypothetical protein [Pyrinomonadaceae bacterium]